MQRRGTAVRKPGRKKIRRRSSSRKPTSGVRDGVHKGVRGGATRRGSVKRPASRRSSRRSTRGGAARKTAAKPRVKTTKPDPLLDALQKVPGIGEVKARELVAAGVRAVDDLRAEPWYSELNDEAKFDLKFGVLRRFPWDYADRLVRLLPSWIMVLGSYRRRRPTVGDLDMVTLKPLDDAVKELRECNGFRVAGEFVSGEKRRVLVLQFEDKYLKADLFHTEPEELPAAMLHWTGSMQWNIRCRKVAKGKGYKLNQYGLFDAKTGKRIPGLKTERDILDYVGITWKEPTDREA